MRIHLGVLKQKISNRLSSGVIALLSESSFTFPKSLPLETQINVVRVDLLYRQNLVGVIALFIYASSYIYASVGIVASQFLWSWYFVLIGSAAARVILSKRWQKRKSEIRSSTEINHWLHMMQMLLFVSGIGWGAIGWVASESSSTTQQMMTALSVVFMSAGAIVCYSASLRAMYAVVVPAMLFWSLGLLRSADPMFRLMGVLGLIYALLGAIAGRAFSKYLNDSLRLTIEHAALLESTQKQLKVRDERDRFEAESKAKSVFLANASHEIRTPLAAINGFTEDLMTREGLDPEIAADLQVIFRNGKYLASLVNDLLDLSKVETGQLYIQKSMISPLKEIEEAILVVKSTFEARRLKLNFTCLDEIPDFVESDSMRFRQVLINLLSNASKFTESGEITIEASFTKETDQSGCLKITVCDTGIGLSNEAAARLFQPFTRGTEKDVQRVPGSGLGLALSRDIARALGGDVQLIRSSVGEGSVFQFTVRTLFATLLSFERSQNQISETRTSDTRPAGSLQNVSILVVDDSVDLQVLMRRFLEREGAKVEVSSNGAEGVSAASKREFDAVFMDIKMPVLDGYQATRQLRERGYSRPVIALTAHANTEDRQLCYQAGCDDYLSKPVDTMQLLKTLKKHLSRLKPETFSSPGEINI